MIAGADPWEEVARFDLTRHDWLRTLLPLPNGVPSHGTSSRLFARRNPAQFAEGVADWPAGACEVTGLRHVAVGWKAARSSPKGTFSGCLHPVGTWAANRSTTGRPGRTALPTRVRLPPGTCHGSYGSSAPSQ